MKATIVCRMLAALVWPLGLAAQNENFRLNCPMQEATLVPPPKNMIQYNDPDYCIVLMSAQDTVVKAVTKGRITNLEFDDETLNGLVMYAKINNKDYYFWYTGIKRLAVRRNENVAASQALGYISPGGKIELQMYQFETPVDITKYLDCGGR